MKLFLIRHGQTEDNIKKIFSGQLDHMLSEKGRQQAAAIAPILGRIPFDRVYSSDLTRAMDTQKLALPQYEAIKLPLLREYSLGSLSGLSYKTVREDYGITNYDYSPFGGESIPMVDQRTKAFLSILEEDPCEYVAAFVHAGIIRSLLRHVLGSEADTSALVNSNCFIAVLTFEDGKWKLLSWNYMGSV